MTQKLSIRIDAGVKKRLDTLSRQVRRSKSSLAAEAITDYVAAEEGRLGELQTALAGLDAGRYVSHEKVSKWLKSWGKPDEAKGNF